jgi:hypothetical protein
MHIILLRILFFTIAIAAIAVCADAKPDTAQRHIRNEAEADSITRIDRNQRCPLLKALCDDTARRSPDSELRALIGRSFADHYYVGLSAGKSWRPLERFGDRDNKLRVYNPTLGVAVRYSF